MGYAKIVSGGEDGRYTIELDFGKAQRDAALAALGAFISKMQNDIGVTLGKIAEEEAKIVPLREAYTDAVNDYIEAAEYLRLNGHLPPGSPTLSTVAMDFAAAQIKRALALMDPLRRRLDALKFLLRAAQFDMARWNSVDAISTRQAWCTTLTEDAAAGSYVATCDIPGDSNLVLIAPECRVPQNSDGYLRARAVMSPEQAFWTAAVQPGWQKYKPTYRWGTCTGINYDDDTMTVALFDQKSDAQDLSVNQASTLTNIPVVYMSCHAMAFEIDDRVVIEFQGQEWSAPRVIGFLDNPKPCFAWQLFTSDWNQNTSFNEDLVTYGRLITMRFMAEFINLNLWLEWEAEAAAQTLTFQVRRDGGDWATFGATTVIEDSTTVTFSASAPTGYTSSAGFSFVREKTGLQRMFVSLRIVVNRSNPISAQPESAYPRTSDAIFEFLATRLDGSVIYNAAFRVTEGSTANEFKHWRAMTPVAAIPGAPLLTPGAYLESILFSGLYYSEPPVTNDVGVPNELAYTLYAETP